MHQVRSAILSGEYSPVTTKEPCRRTPVSNGSLASLRIAREERRSTNQRREDRHWGIVDRAIIVFRRKKMLVKVINVSTSGIMVESEIVPRIGETIGIEFEGFERLVGTVRWVKEGRVGLDVGDGSIALG